MTPDNPLSISDILALIVAIGGDVLILFGLTSAGVALTAHLVRAHRALTGRPFLVSIYHLLLITILLVVRVRASMRARSMAFCGR